MPLKQGKIGKHAIALLVLGALARLPTLLLPRHTSIIIYFDGSYVQAARDILHLHFHSLGYRPPFYPLLIALCGLQPRWVCAAQSVLGIVASLLIYRMALRRTGHALFSLLVGVASSLTPEVLFYESSIMSEALASFLLVVSIWLIDECESRAEKRLRYPLALGVVVALAALTRPLMLCLVPVYLCFVMPLVPLARILRRGVVRRAVAYSLPIVALVFGWCGLMYLNTGYFTPTTASGMNLMDQVDPYVGLVPDHFAMLRDAWLQSQSKRKVIPSRNAIPVFYGAIELVEKQTGESRFQVSHEYQLLALYLALHHPLLYLRRAEQGWMQFWGEPTADETEWPPISGVTAGEFVMTLSSFLVREFEAAFLILALLAIPCALLRPQAFTKLEYLIFTLALWCSVFAALTEFGENRRFCVPFYMLIVYTLMTRAWLWMNAAAPLPPRE